MFFKKEVKEDKSKVGGIPFFISILCIIVFSINNLLMLPRLIYDRYETEAEFFKDKFTALLIFAILSVISAFLSSKIFKNQWTVLIHEFKHRIFADLVGNKYKEMKIGKDEGHVVYEYTPKTKMFNAFIALAPYYCPLFTFLLALCTGFFIYQNPYAIAAVLGLGFGADLYLGLKDAGPYQTDFSNLVGGFYIGITYTICANVTIGTTLAAFAFDGYKGFLFLCSGLIGLVQFLIPTAGKTIENIFSKM